MYLFAKLLAGGFVANKVLLIKPRPVAVKECNGCIDPNQTAQQMHGLSSTIVVTYEKYCLCLDGVLTVVVLAKGASALSNLPGMLNCCDATLHGDNCDVPNAIRRQMV